MEYITPEQLYDESTKNIITHRRRWENVDDDTRWRVGHYTECANTLFAEWLREHAANLTFAPRRG